MKTLIAAIVEGDSFHALDRVSMKAEMSRQEDAGNKDFSHFGPGANEFKPRLVSCLIHMVKQVGGDRSAIILHNDEEAAFHSDRLGKTYGNGEFTELGKKVDGGSDLMFYEGLARPCCR